MKNWGGGAGIPSLGSMGGLTPKGLKAFAQGGTCYQAKFGGPAVTLPRVELSIEKFAPLWMSPFHGSRGKI